MFEAIKQTLAATLWGSLEGLGFGFVALLAILHGFLALVACMVSRYKHQSHNEFYKIELIM